MTSRQEGQSHIRAQGAHSDPEQGSPGVRVREGARYGFSVDLLNKKP